MAAAWTAAPSSRTAPLSVPAPPSRGRTPRPPRTRPAPRRCRTRVGRPRLWCRPARPGRRAPEQAHAAGRQVPDARDERGEDGRGSPGSQVREGLGEPGGVVHLEEDVRDPRLGHPPVEVGDQGKRPRPARRLPFSRRGGRCLRCCRQRSHRPAPRRPAGAGPRLAGAGRLRSASATAGADSSAFSDVAVAARARQPDVAGAERVPQVEQHRRLPEAVIGLGAQQPAPLRIRPQEAGRPHRAVAAQNADRFQQGLGVEDGGAFAAHRPHGGDRPGGPPWGPPPPHRVRRRYHAEVPAGDDSGQGQGHLACTFAPGYGFRPSPVRRLRQAMHMQLGLPSSL